MKEQNFTYRIVKIGGRAVAVAVTLAGLSIGTASAQSNTNLGQTVTSTVPSDGPTYEVSPASYGVTQSRTGDIVYGNQVLYSCNGWTDANGFDNCADNDIYNGATYAIRQSALAVNQFYNIVDGNGLNSYTVGSGTTFNASTRGSRAYITFEFQSGGDNYYDSHDGTEPTPTSKAIDIAGNMTFTGSSQINGAASASSFTVQKTGVVFHGAVTGNILLASGGSALLNSGSDLTGNIDFQGNNATFTFSDGSNVTGNIDTSVARTGTVVFQSNSAVSGSIGATAALREMQTTGSGTVTIAGASKINLVELNAAGTVAFGGGLDTRLASLERGTVSFNNVDATVQIGNANSSAATSLNADITTDTNNNGTLTMVRGPQTITGSVGADGKALKRLNIGGVYFDTASGFDTSSAVYSETTVNGNVHVQGTVLNNNGTSNNSSLTMASGFNITSPTITTAENGMGNLTMAGGAQTVTGAVGTNLFRLDQVNSGATGGDTSFTANVFADTVSNLGTGTSTFNTNVTATSIVVGSGISNFTNNVTTSDPGAGVNQALGGLGQNNQTRIGTGVANFNTNGSGTAQTHIVFTANRDPGATSSATGSYTASTLGSASANLVTGLTGTVNFGGNDAVVNVWDGKAISGAIGTATTSNTGVVNYRGDGSIGSTVGASALGVAELNINTNSEQSTPAGVTADGDIFAGVVNLKNSGTLTLADGVDITATKNAPNGNVTALTGTQQAVATQTDNTGVLKILGSSTITGAVGEENRSLARIETGVTESSTTFNNMVFAKTLVYADGDGTVTLNGQVGPNANTAGIVGQIDFDGGTGLLKIGDGVNLSTVSGLNADVVGVQFANATNATMTFDGSAKVTGVLGGNTTGRSTIATINAGVDGATVTFTDDVYVASSTFHVTGTGIVNLQGNLNGPLIYNAGAAGSEGPDGSVNVADGKVITGLVSTVTGGVGILNFVGGTSTQADMGAIGSRLFEINLHAATSDDANSPLSTAAKEVNIAHNLYANATTIGSDAEGIGATTANITETGKFLGNALNLANNTTLNTAGTVTVTGNSVVFNHTRNTNGTLTNAATVTRSSTGTGAINVNNATLNFAVANAGWDAEEGGGLASDSSSSSKITGGSGSSLNIGEEAQVNLSLLGSLRNGAFYTLVEVASGNDETGNLTDNSFVIDTELSRAGGDLRVTAKRNADVYIAKSGTAGHFSNPAAQRLGALGRLGEGYSADMQTVFNKLDINQWGYGSNAANLAVQAKRLAPVANNSVTETSFATAAMAVSTLGNRMSELRGDVAAPSAQAKGLASGDGKLNDGVWVKSFFNGAKQKAAGDYDGYSARVSGLSIGLDSRPDRSSIVGLALSYGNATTKQSGFRTGDNTVSENYQIAAYGSYDITESFYVEGALAASRQDAKSRRATAVDRIAQASFDSTQSTGRLGAGYRFLLDDQVSSLTPMLALERTRRKQDAYTETGAGDIGLDVEGQSYSRTQTGLGLRYNTTQQVNGMVVKPELSLFAMRDRGHYAQDVRASYIGDLSSEVFTTAVAPVNRRSLNLGLGVNILTGKTSSMQVRYDMNHRTGFNSHSAAITARWDY